MKTSAAAFLVVMVDWIMLMIFITRRSEYNETVYQGWARMAVVSIQQTSNANIAGLNFDKENAVSWRAAESGVKG